jgi:hypothetical protein
MACPEPVRANNAASQKVEASILYWRVSGGERRRRNALYIQPHHEDETDPRSPNWPSAGSCILNEMDLWGTRSGNVEK